MESSSDPIVLGNDKPFLKGQKESPGRFDGTLFLKIMAVDETNGKYSRTLPSAASMIVGRVVEFKGPQKIIGQIQDLHPKDGYLPRSKWAQHHPGQQISMPGVTLTKWGHCPKIIFGSEGDSRWKTAESQQRHRSPGEEGGQTGGPEISLNTTNPRKRKGKMNVSQGKKARKPKIA